MQSNLTPRLLLLAPAVAFAFANVATAQIFGNKLFGVPQGDPSNNSRTNEVDFGDVDLDGDFDAVFADGDALNDQNRIWINFGGLQGTLIGAFNDETSSRFPAVLDETRDLDFADIDSDGDLDLHVSNVSSISNQGNRWWVNQGHAQSGTLGFFVDDTAARWVGLGGAGSSLQAGLVANGTFITWCGDSEFGDLDNDGDLDVVHASYGQHFGGQVPSRIFLNDGNGAFSEFNPTGFQLSGANIDNGNPALWAEGLQLSNTTDATGTTADIASSSLDVDLGDIDGDFDLDLLNGGRDELPRLFANRLTENGGSTLGFRDVTSSRFPVGYSTGSGHASHEMGDLDDDGDLDILGVDWLPVTFNADDGTLRNDGNGSFSALETLASSNTGDSEGDFFDYDQDGDLDVLTTSRSTWSRLYGGDGTGALVLVTSLTTPLPVSTGTDSDTCDLDGDGDTDAIQTNTQTFPNLFWSNLTTGNDVHAPYIPRVENPGAQTAAQGALGLRAHVHDNASYHRTVESRAVVRVSVDDFELPAVQATSSMGQVFRAEIPMHLVGSVAFAWEVTDHAGNTGTSNSTTYTSTSSSTFAVDYGIASADANGIAPTVDLLALPIPGERIHFGITGSSNAAYVLAYAPLSSFAFFLPGLGFININSTTANTSIVGSLDANGRAVLSRKLPRQLQAGQIVYLQALTIALLPPMTPTIGTSLGLEVTFQ